MEIIISWEIALVIVMAYFVTKYLYDVFMKMATGCQDPFNPLFSYRDYPTWKKGYNRGVSTLSKAVNKIIADSCAENIRILQEMESDLNKISQAIDEYENKLTKELNG
ncbi:hypothetical protein [Sphingobacterium kitahiroshimense]|uniref:Uncharacterized protein n=1 Tax=Sphingobacterium kitahiroshimense TaxID=470446 RepID=A0ABV0BR44_9SPHI